jgi:hypothetical protein
MRQTWIISVFCQTIWFKSDLKSRHSSFETLSALHYSKPHYRSDTEIKRSKPVIWHSERIVSLPFHNTDNSTIVTNTDIVIQCTFYENHDTLPDVFTSDLCIYQSVGARWGWFACTYSRLLYPLYPSHTGPVIDFAAITRSDQNKIRPIWIWTSRIDTKSDRSDIEMEPDKYDPSCTKKRTATERSKQFWTCWKTSLRGLRFLVIEMVSS